jgi:Protein of unknown function (DUF2971)
LELAAHAMNEFTLQNTGIEYLWHYTSVAALRAIVESKRLFATDILYLNDSTEYRHGFEVIKEKVLAKEQDFRIVWDRQLAGFGRMQDGLPLGLCVFCLTEEADDLSQWRAYAPSGGVAIGFSLEGMRSAFDKLNPSSTVRLEKCTYDEDAKVAQLTTAISESLEWAKSVSRDPQNDGMVHERAAKDFFPKLKKLAPTLKHSAFAKEKEWRLIVSATEEQLSFRTGADLLIPYFSLTMPDHAIRRIRMGPALEPELAASSVRQLLKRNGMGTQVLPATIPVRSLRL